MTIQTQFCIYEFIFPNSCNGQIQPKLSSCPFQSALNEKTVSAREIHGSKHRGEAEGSAGTSPDVKTPEKSHLREETRPGLSTAGTPPGTPALGTPLPGWFGAEIEPRKDCSCFFFTRFAPDISSVCLFFQRTSSVQCN